VENGYDPGLLNQAGKKSHVMTNMMKHDTIPTRYKPRQQVQGDKKPAFAGGLSGFYFCKPRELCEVIFESNY